MAGRARTKAIRESLERRTVAHFELSAYGQPDDPNSLNYVEEWVGSGKFIIALAADIQQELGFEELWPGTLERVLIAEYGKEAVASALQATRERASRYLAEGSVAIVDAADGDSSSAVSKANAQARSRQWLAEKFSPEAFGQKAGVNVSINVGQLHLAALRQISATPKEVTATITAPETARIGAE